MAKKISTAQIYLSHLPSFLHLCIWEELIVVHLTSICRNNYDVACPMNFKNYPYDTQICKVKYESCKFPNSHSSNFDNLATFNTWWYDMQFADRPIIPRSVRHFFQMVTPPTRCFWNGRRDLIIARSVSIQEKCTKSSSSCNAKSLQNLYKC